MNSRERHTLGGVAIAPPPDADGSPPGMRQPTEPSVSSTLTWEQRIDRLSPEEKRQLMNLAQSQGLILQSQLPNPSNPLLSTDGKPRTLGQLLALDPKELKSLPFLESPPDPRLTDHQREVVSLALESGDFLLVESLPQTGKSQVIRQIIERALQRKWRVLYLATASRVDALLSDLPEEQPRLRVLARDEVAPPAIARWTLAQQERNIRETALQRAQQNLNQAQEIDTNLRQVETLATQLEADLKQLPEAKQKRDQLEQRRNQPDADPSDRAKAIREQFQAPLDEKTKERDHLQEELKQLDHERSDAKSQAQQVKTLCEAKTAGRWWSASFWKAKFDKSLPEKSVHMEEVIKHLDEESQKRQQQLALLATEISHLESQRDQQIQQFRDGERSRLQSEIETEFQNLNTTISHLQVEIDRKRRTIRSVLNHTGDEFAFDAIHEQTRNRLKENEQELVFARRWVDFLQNEGETFVRQNRMTIPLVAGLFASVLADPFFNDSAVRAAPFDLLFIDEASHLGEAEFNQAISRARRVVLISEVGEPDLDAEKASRAPSRGVSKYSVAPRKRADVFERLWHRFHTPVWSFEGRRLIATLVPLTTEQYRFVERESVADNPLVELRIYTPEVGEPSLAAVAFAPNMTAGQAHEFLYRELGEVMIDPRSQLIRWSEENGTVSARLGDDAVTETVPLGDGIVQELHHFFTVGFQFAAPIWDRDRAAIWLAEQFQRHPSGRCVRLDLPLQMNPKYVPWVNELFRLGYRTSVEEVSQEPVAHLIKVPSRPVLREPVNGHANDRRSPQPRLSGAGLEFDLADIRRRGELNPEWAACLPHHGFINKTEAEAILDWLPQLMQKHPGRTLGISSLYPAQNALIRTLLHRTEWASRVLLIDPHHPEVSRCDWLLLSLTRSHISRAVTFGEHPRIMQRLLTLPSEGVYFFGDVGTLSRRAGWEGACDQLDEESAGRERDWISVLLRYMNGKGHHPTLFQVLEGARHDV